MIVQSENEMGMIPFFQLAKDMQRQLELNVQAYNAITQKADDVQDRWERGRLMCVVTALTISTAESREESILILHVECTQYVQQRLLTSSNL